MMVGMNDLILHLKDVDDKFNQPSQLFIDSTLILIY
jgi:hypothetical protein